MHVICIMVSSLNGFTTNGTTLRSHYIHSWTSKEDQGYFAKQIEKAQCILMGRTTYEVIQSHIVHKSGRLRVILTSHPERYKKQEIPGQLEFMNGSPSMLIKNLEERGFSQVLLVGGSTTNAAFLKEHRINELWLTIEPVIFPSGTPLFATGIKQKLKLLSIKKLNTQGTLLLKYSLQN